MVRNLNASFRASTSSRASARSCATASRALLGGGAGRLGRRWRRRRRRHRHGAGSGGIANQVLESPPARSSRGLFPIQTAVGPLNASLAQLLAAVNPYLPEITQAGQWLQNAIERPLATAGAGPAPRSCGCVPVLTPHGRAATRSPRPARRRTTARPEGCCG